MKYDYLENLKGDIKDYIEDNKEYLEGKDREELYDIFFLEDAITGNASGSYTFSTWEAEENICHNLDLAQEAYEMFGYDGIPKDAGAEAIDVTIRCYLLGQVLDEVLEDIEWGEE